MSELLTFTSCFGLVFRTKEGVYVPVALSCSSHNFDRNSHYFQGSYKHIDGFEKKLKKERKAVRFLCK